MEIKFADSLGVSTGGWRKRTDYVNDLFTRGPTEVVARVGSESFPGLASAVDIVKICRAGGWRGNWVG